jgi:hypothetical protein
MRYILSFLLLTSLNGMAQWKDYTLTTKNDTVNRIDKKNQKQGKWIIRTEDNMGEPGFQTEGLYKDNEKEGLWNIYSLSGDPMGEENFVGGQKNKKQQYFDIHGNLVREENWKALTPDQKFDTVIVPDWRKDPTGNSMKKVIVKLEGNSIKEGAFKFYDDQSRLMRSDVYKADKLEETTTYEYDVVTGKIKAKNIEKYDITTGKVIAKAGYDKGKTSAKPKQVENFEKMKKGKKKKFQDGST